MWISGLLYKLHDKGIAGKDLRKINSSLRNATSRVIYSGCLSEPFAIEQGTRQSSICAPFYYTVFVDGRLEQLQASPHGLEIGDVTIAAPTQADDIVLLSLTRSGLQRLVNICHDYANRWRYTYNPSKCAAMIMHRKQYTRTQPQVIIYGDSTIQEATSYVHLVITQSPCGKSPHNIDVVKRKMRGTYFSTTSGPRATDVVEKNVPRIFRLTTSVLRGDLPHGDCVMPRWT